LLAFAFTAPLIVAVLPDFVNPAYAEPGWGEGLKLSADLAGLVTLTPLHPLAGVDWVAELRAVIEGRSRFSDANTLFLGYGILALALLGFAVRRRETVMWLWGAVIFIILSLGPLLTLNGQNRFNLDGLDVTFPLPFALLHYLPIINANRVPNRFGIPLTMALAVLAGYGVDWILRQVGKRLEIPQSESPISQSAIPLSPYLPILNLFVTHLSHFFVFLCLLAFLLFDQFSAPLPLTDARIPEVYAQIGAEPDNFTLMQLPLGWRNSYGTLGAERTQLQYYQAAHHRPMLGGNTSRNPAFLFDYFRRIPLFYALTETELYRPVDDDTLQRARAQATGLMTLYNIKYLVIHDPLPQRKPYEDTYLATRKLALDLIPHQVQPVYQSPGVAAFAVAQAPLPNPLTLDFGHWLTDPNRGEGWAGNEDIFAATANWATTPKAAIFFPAHVPGSRTLRLQLAPFTSPGAPPQQVSLSLNQHPLPDSYWLHEGWQVIEAELPAAHLQTGLNRLTLRFAHTAVPRQALPANRAIGQTGLDTPVDLEVNSGADFAFITVDFGDNAVDASAHRRGVNVAVVNPTTGRLVEQKGFDTAANEFEAAALAAFINQIPAGHIVIAATQGADAAAYFDAATRAALAAIGGPVDLPAPPFSIIGVKGAAPGAALLAVGEGAAYLRLGAPPDTRPLAAAVDWVEIAAP
jgi:hypothetical protein